MIAPVFIGLTGSGKTTVAKAVAEKLELPYIGSGEIARKLAETDPYAEAGLKRGDYAPEQAMRTEVLARIEEATVANGDFVIEGFPRRLEQLYILESVPGIRPLYFVLVVNTLTCMRRLIARGRKDDHPDAVVARIQAFQEHTQPLIASIGADERIHLYASQSPVHVVESALHHYRKAQRERAAGE